MSQTREKSYGRFPEKSWLIARSDGQFPSLRQMENFEWKYRNCDSSVCLMELALVRVWRDG